MTRPLHELAREFSAVCETLAHAPAVVQSTEFKYHCEHLAYELNEPLRDIEAMMKAMFASMAVYEHAPYGLLLALGVAAGLNTPRQAQWLNMVHVYTGLAREMGGEQLVNFMRYGYQAVHAEPKLPVGNHTNLKIIAAMATLNEKSDLSGLDSFFEAIPKPKALAESQKLKSKTIHLFLDFQGYGPEYLKGVYSVEIPDTAARTDHVCQNTIDTFLVDFGKENLQSALITLYDPVKKEVILEAAPLADYRKVSTLTKISGDTPAWTSSFADKQAAERVLKLQGLPQGLSMPDESVTALQECAHAVMRLTHEDNCLELEEKTQAFPALMRALMGRDVQADMIKRFIREYGAPEDRGETLYFSDTAELISGDNPILSPMHVLAFFSCDPDRKSFFKSFDVDWISLCQEGLSNLANHGFPKEAKTIRSRLQMKSMLPLFAQKEQDREPGI